MIHSFCASSVESVMDYFRNLFKADFMPHGHCYFWKPEILWPHVLGDAFIVLSYFIIPVILIYLIKKRQDVKVTGLVLAFAAFILFCGTTHLLSIVSVWYPIYRFEGVIKVLTAIVSVGTVIALTKHLPWAISMPSPQAMESLNRELTAEIEMRNIVEKELRDEIEMRNQAQRELHEKQYEFTLTMDNAPIGMTVLNPDGEWIDINKALCNMFGYSLQEMFATSLGELTHKEDRNADMEQLLQMDKGELESYQVNKRFIHKDGSIIWGVMSVSVMRDEDGNPLHIIIQIMDITDQVNAELEMLELNRMLESKVKQRTAELELANEDLESFSYSVSHDLRNPLTAINLYCGELIDEYSEGMDEDYLSAVDGIVKNCRRMDQLIRDVLDFSRAGSAALHIGTVDMQALFMDVYDSLAITVEDERKIHIEVNDLPAAEGDTTLLRQVVTNLLSNAIKYTGKTAEAHIVVNGMVQDDQLVYSVTDNGVGFNQKFSKKLFKVFERLHSVSEFSGTGVGLAISDRIVKRHGGKMWAESAPDVETTFYFALPLPRKKT